MKVLSFLVILCFLIPLVGCGSSTSSVAGLYVSEDYPGGYLRLNSNGTFVMPLGFHGTWQIDGDELTFITPLGLERWRIEGNKIIDPGGSIWVKKGTAIPETGAPDLVVVGGQSWGARNWFVTFDGAEWYRCTLLVHLTVNNTGTNVADFGHSTTAGYPYTLYVVDKYGQKFYAKGTGAYDWYQQKFYPGEPKSGTLEFQIDPRSERVWLQGPRWHNTPPCSFDLGNVPSACE